MFMNRDERDSYLENMIQEGLLLEGRLYDIVLPFQLPLPKSNFGIKKDQGYRLVCEIKNRIILIDKLQIALPDGAEYPMTLGRKPVRGYDILADFTMLWGLHSGMVYENLNFPLRMSGNLLIGTEVADYSTPMLPDFAMANRYDVYQELLLLEFQAGILKNIKDVSGMSKETFQEISGLASQLTEEE